MARAKLAGLRVDPLVRIDQCPRAGPAGCVGPDRALDIEL